MSESLAKIFDVEHVAIEPVISTLPATITPETPVESIEDIDFTAARSNTYDLIDISKAALNTAVRVASESENPRALEVLGQLLKTSSEINRQLIQMSKDKQEVKIAKKDAGSTVQPQPQINSQNTIVFSGNGAELNKMLAEKLNAK